jgi:hypothetical protein
MLVVTYEIGRRECRQQVHLSAPGRIEEQATQGSVANLKSDRLKGPHHRAS